MFCDYFYCFRLKKGVFRLKTGVLRGFLGKNLKIRLHHLEEREKLVRKYKKIILIRKEMKATVANEILKVRLRF